MQASPSTGTTELLQQIATEYQHQNYVVLYHTLTPADDADANSSKDNFDVALIEALHASRATTTTTTTTSVSSLSPSTATTTTNNNNKAATPVAVCIDNLQFASQSLLDTIQLIKQQTTNTGGREGEGEWSHVRIVCAASTDAPAAMNRVFDNNNNNKSSAAAGAGGGGDGATSYRLSTLDLHMCDKGDRRSLLKHWERYHGRT